MESVVETLAGLEMLERVRFRVAEERVEAITNSLVVEDDRVVALVSERTGTRQFRIQSQWASGWLPPLVDATESRGPGAEFAPVGTLREIEAVGHPTL